MTLPVSREEREGVIRRFVSGLSFPKLFLLLLGLFFADLLMPDMIPFLDEMILGGITPNRLTWNIHVRTSNEVVRGLCTSYPTRAFTLYQSMRSRGISVEVETLDSLVKCLCKKGEFQKAVQLVNEIVADGCIPNKGTWKVLIGHTLDKTMVGEASEYLLRDLGI